jgi:energy-coupling factor transport system substrate-specific component
MWKYPRMIVLVAVSAALYAAAITVFQTPPPLSVRFIGQLMPMPLALLFGPAAVWGIALGNLVSEFVTGIVSIGTIFGIPGNLILGYAPWLIWKHLRPLADGRREVDLRSPRHWALYAVAAIGSAFACATVIAWPLDLLGIVPFPFLVNLIGVQDALVGLIAVVLLLLVYKRVEALGLVWWEILDPADQDRASGPLPVVGAWLIVAGGLLGWALGGVLVPTAAPVIGGIGVVAVLLGLILTWDFTRAPAERGVTVPSAASHIRP